MKHGKSSVTKVGGAGRIVARVLSLILVGISFTEWSRLTTTQRRR